MQNKNTTDININNTSNINYKRTSNNKMDLDSSHNILRTAEILSIRECSEEELSNFLHMARENVSEIVTYLHGRGYISRSDKLSLTESGRDMLRFIKLLGDGYEAR